MTNDEAIRILQGIDRLIGDDFYNDTIDEAIEMAIEALSTETIPQSEQYKKGFEDAKRAFLVEYARESQNMRKRIAQLEMRLNAQKAISAERPEGEWINEHENGHGFWFGTCSQCGKERHVDNYCGNCGAEIRSEE